jgi:Na+/H+ antiporter NhaC
MLGLYITGQDPESEQSIKDIVGNADSYKALLWGSLAGVLVAALLSMTQGILNLQQTVDSWFKGVRSMLAAMIILLLAWSLSAVTDVLETSQYLSQLLDGKIPPQLVPALIFIISAATAYATGSSWGAMGILIPLFVPLTWSIMQSAGIANADHLYILYVAISSILAGAVWGDHCSPISDTTILSSMACNCDHVEHVRTQIPYAVYAGGFALLVGIIPVSYGLSVWLSLAISATLMIIGVNIIGKKVDE